MKTSQTPDLEDLWISITTALKAASDAGTWAFWRERFNTNHPDHIRHQEIENPQQFAYANWIAAKHIYCLHKDDLDKYLKYKQNGEAYPGLSVQADFFIAMKRTVEDEMTKELEEQLLKEEEVNTKWENDEYLVEEEEALQDDNLDFDDVEDETLDDDELDEDEEYIRSERSSPFSHDSDDEESSYDYYEDDEY
jgi:hypothetical protein